MVYQPPALDRAMILAAILATAGQPPQIWKPEKEKLAPRRARRKKRRAEDTEESNVTPAPAAVVAPITDTKRLAAIAALID